MARALTGEMFTTNKTSDMDREMRELFVFTCRRLRWWTRVKAMAAAVEAIFIDTTGLSLSSFITNSSISECGLCGTTTTTPTTPLLP